ncbi:GMC family oxidoreductase [Streptomyces sp. TS71-3]|uniref:GMC family oxidoreductase n=1 Tax=Streptomyces sp. TS71-3 TaxID=2733862 RepID=UPI001BB41B2B|nr:GMC family oxidoreductase N-terminal domain-containing protein [Streptomyces sp. TS71-3]
MTVEDTRAFDYVVIGAGSAGSAVTGRLVAQTGATVLVLEAGERGADTGSLAEPTRWMENMGAAYDYGYHYEPHRATHDRVLPLPRGKLLGGSGGINGMLWTRGQHDDYDEWAAAGNRGWDYDSVLPLFRRSEDWEDGAGPLHGAGGPVHVERAHGLHPVATALIRAGRSLGLPYLDDATSPAEGVGPSTLNVRDGRRENPWQAFVGPLADEDRLTVATGADARRLTFSRGRCTGVEYAVDGHLSRAVARGEVVLCAGAIDTPRLLMRSGVGPADDLADLGIEAVADLPGVGRDLQEHVLAAGLCLEAAEPLGPLKNNLEGSVAFLRSTGGSARPDLMFVTLQIPFVSPEIGEQYAPPENGFCIFPGLAAPRSRGRLTMHADGSLEIQPNLLAEQADVDALVEAVDIGFELASDPAFADITERWAVPDRRLDRAETAAFVRDAALPYFHAAGTCAMGPVVDEELRVHGVDGLRIADASVMPAITRAFPHATTVMIGEQAGRLLTA